MENQELNAEQSDVFKGAHMLLSASKLLLNHDKSVSDMCLFLSSKVLDELSQSVPQCCECGKPKINVDNVPSEEQAADEIDQIVDKIKAEM